MNSHSGTRKQSKPNPRNITHIKSWKPFSEAVESVFPKVQWLDTLTNPPIIPIHLKSRGFPIDFVHGYEVIGRGIVAYTKKSESYRRYTIVWTQIYPDSFYVMVVSKERDTFRYRQIGQTKGKQAKGMTIVCVHLNGYAFVKTTKKQLKLLRKKLQKIPRSPSVASGQQTQTIIEGR